MKKLVMGLLLTTSVSSMAKAKIKSVEAQFRPGEIIIKLKAAHARSFLSRKSTYGVQVKELMNLKSGNFVVLNTSNKSLTNIIAKLNADPAVEYAEPNYIYRAIDIKNSKSTQDPKFEVLWGLLNKGDNEPAGSRGGSANSGVAGIDINAINAWKITKGSKKVKIAVIDTGIDYNHPDLKSNIWTNQAEADGRAGVDDDGNGYIDDIHGYDFANNDGDPMDGNGHGTHCAGTIAAEHDNNIGVAGVMANATLVGIKFLTDEGSGDTASAIKAVDYATKLNVDIMSNSWGGGGHSKALKEAIERARDAGIVFTAAAGNSATNNNIEPHYPSNYKVDNVISVAANNYNNKLAFFSCYGSKTVHVSAPGRNILSTVPNNSYDVFSGTSMATPHVSGVIGLYIAEHGRRNVKQIRNELMRSSVYGKDYSKKIISKGRVDAYNFLTGVVAQRPYEPSPSDWLSSAENYESIHPYANDTSSSKKFTIPGAKFIRIKFSKVDMEDNYDFVHVIDAAGNINEKITGSHSTFISDYVEGDTINLKILSDSSVNMWGYKVSEVQYVK
jgi:subtilisin family serine protease